MADEVPMAYPKGVPRSDETKRKISDGARRVFATASGKAALAARPRRPHSEETKRRIGEAHRRKMESDPAYRADRLRFAEEATRVARDRFLASLATTKLRIGDIPLSKNDQRIVRSLPCAMCRSRKKPRQLAHIVARSHGGPQLHVWGNVVPLCTDCHATADHHADS